MLLAPLWASPAAADRASPSERAPAGQALPPWPQRADPPPLVTKGYLELTLRLERGRPSLVKQARGSFSRPQAILPRYAGRYAVELYAGKTLLDVIRFDYPLAAVVGDPDRARQLPLAAGVHAETTVVVPADERLTRARLLDTKTRASYPLALKLAKGAACAPTTALPLRLGSFQAPEKPPEPTSAPPQRKQPRRSGKPRR